MNVFKIHPDGWVVLRRQVYRRIVMTTLLTIAVVVAIYYRQIRQGDHYSIGICVLIVLMQVGRLTYIHLRKQRGLFESFTVEITADGITRIQEATQDLSLSHLEITSISKSRNGDITVKGMENQDLILIPPIMERQEEMEQLLSGFKPFSTTAESPWQPYIQWIFPLLMVLLLMGNNPDRYRQQAWVLLVVALTLAVMMLYNMHIVDLGFLKTLLPIP
ncbi:hypothetical protein ACDQ55_05485 [Chitinophaga sp. 30R24]|uniref:hypothetical protein n=1 Tax=Chitinophaga sp. 30R24 TaxID=3248838 RepID=UPI003B90A39E